MRIDRDSTSSLTTPPRRGTPVLRQPTAGLHRHCSSVAMLVTAACVLSMAVACSPRGESSPASVGKAGSSTASSPTVGAIRLTFRTDDARKASAAVSVAHGGTVTASAGDGSQFSLIVPAGAVVVDTIITLTPLADVHGIGQDGTQAAVRLEPDGLIFQKLSRLTITPAHPIPPAHQLLFLSKSDGTDAVRAPVDPRSKDMTLLLSHFSIGGGADVTPQQAAAFDAQRVSNAAARINAELNAMLQQARIDSLLGKGYQPPDIQRLMDEWKREVTDPIVDRAISDCSGSNELESNIEIVGWNRTMEMLGLHEYALSNLVSFSSFETCDEDAKKRCKEAKDPSIYVRFVVAHRRQGQMFGLPWLAFDSDQLVLLAKRICLPHSYSAEGGADEFHGKGTICDSAKPFTISGDGVMAKFTPATETQGSYAYSGDMSGLHVEGKGTYVINLDEHGGTLVATGPGSVVTPMGTKTADGTELYQLTLIDPCGK
jgi:hypothetical protein